MKLTSLKINILFHIYSMHTSIPNRDSPVVIEALNELVENGLVVHYSHSTDPNSEFKMKTRGYKFIDLLLNTPLPVEKTTWIDPRDGKEIEV
jgi:hypothetical protein